MSRYAQIKENGFNEEDATNINQVTKALRDGAGINAIDGQTGQLRNFSDIIDELMGKWDKMGENNKRYIATTLAGTYQLNRFLTLMENSDDAIKNYDIAMNSAGTANKKFKIYQESASASLDKMTAAIEGFWQKSLNSSVIIGAIDLFGKFVGVLESAGGIIPIVAGLLAGVLVASIGSAIIAVKALIAEFTLLNLVSGGIPILIGLVVTAATGLGMWAASASKASKATDELNKTLEVQSRSYKSLREEQDKLNKESEEYSANATKEAVLAEALSKKLYDLADDTDMTSLKKEQMAQIVDRLNEILPELGLNYDKETGKLNLQKDAVDGMITSFKNLALVKAAATKSTDAAIRIVEAELNINKLDIKRKTITDANNAKFSKYDKEVQKNPDLKDWVDTERKKSSVGVNVQLNEVQSEIENNKSIIKEAEGYIKDLDEITQKYSVKPSGGKPDPTITGNQGGGSGSKSSSSIGDDDKLIEKDRYFALNQEIERYNSLLAYNKAQQELAPYKEKIKLMQEEQDLYRQQQEVLHKLNTERRKERDEVITKNLSKYGVKFSGTGDGLNATNSDVVLEKYRQLANSNKKLKPQYEELKDELQKFFDVQKDIRQTSTDWNNYEKDINGVTKAIEDLNKKQKELSDSLLKSYADSVKKTLQSQIDSIDEEKRVYSEKIQTEIDGLNKTLDVLNDKNELLEEQNNLNEKSLNLEKVRQKLLNVQTERTARILRKDSDGKARWMWEADPKAVREAQEEVADLEKDFNETKAEIAENAQKRSIEAQIQDLEDGLKEKEKLWEKDKDVIEKAMKSIDLVTETTTDNQITSLQELIDKYKTAGIQIPVEVQKIIDILSKIQIPNLDLSGLTKGVTTTNPTTTASTQTTTPTSNWSTPSTTETTTGTIKNGVSYPSENPDDYGGFVAPATKGSGVFSIVPSTPITTIDTTSVIEKMKANSLSWTEATTDEQRKILAASNLQLGTSIGATRGSDGVWRDASGNRLYDSGGVLPSGEMATNLSGEPERILSPQQTKSFNKLVDFLPSIMGVVGNIMPKTSVSGFAPSLAGVGGNGGDTNYYFDNVSIQANSVSSFLNQIKRNIRS